MSEIVEIQAEEDAEVPPPVVKPNGKKKLIIAGCAATLLLLGGGGAGFLFLGGKAAHKTAAGGNPNESSMSEGTEQFVDVPPIIVNLRSTDGVARLVKVHIMLVAGTMGPEPLKARLPMLIDSYQPFLRELRPEDLAGSAAVFRVKEEMMSRATSTLGAGAVKNVLVQDLVQQ